MMFHVKHHELTTRDFEYILTNAAVLGVGLTDATAGRLLQHLDLLLDANKRVNLTAIRDRNAGLRLHVIDSLAVVPFVNDAPVGPVADLGSGGGFPGIPIALTTDRSVTLVESIKKKASFLQDSLIALGLTEQVSVASWRAEEEALIRPGHYSTVVARALSSLPSLIELASPLLRQRGVLIAMKGRLEDSEIESGRGVAAMVGMKELGIREYSLPDGGEMRTIAVFERRGRSSVKLPRNPGMAQKKPLS